MTRRTVVLAAAVGVLCTLPSTTTSRAAAPQRAGAAKRIPKLIVLIVVDQMRADYVTRFRSDWTGGLKRLATEGAWFSNAAYPYLLTDTCAGHSTIATGTFPRTHGMIGDFWWDRATGKRVGCTTDPAATNVGYVTRATGVGDSGRNLQVPTFADEMRRQRGARVVSVAGKARSAIGMAGHGGDAVAWLSDTFDYWETSSEFSQAANESASAFVAAHPIIADAGRTWDRVRPASQYRSVDGDPDEARVGSWSTEFPHVVSASTSRDFTEQWHRSPFPDEYTAKLGTALIDALSLGARESTDVLALSFSATDWVGHRFGPESQEVQDTQVRLDGIIGTLFEHLDATVGRGSYVVALTADHGVERIPERLAKGGLDAGRVHVRALTDAVEAQLARSLGPGKYVADAVGGGSLHLYFSSGVYDGLRANAVLLDAVISTIVRTPGVLRVFRAEQLDKGQAGRLARAARLSRFAARSGDLVVALKPDWVTDINTAEHGNGTPDDQRVPIFLMGPGIKAGEYRNAVSPADIAPTLAAICGITMPSTEGHPLRWALQIRKPS